MPLLEKDLLKTIRRIQIQTTHLATDLLAGAYKSAFRGKGIEFEEAREYQPGDEVRSLDWNVTARMGRPYVKSFREERELTVMLVVDVSASSRFGSVNRSKGELIAEIGAVLAFSAIKNNDKVGLLLFSDRVEKYLAPKKGSRHVLRVIRDLLVFEPEHRGTDLAGALAYFGKVNRRRGICFVISDFLCGSYEQEISLLAKEHDVIAISVNDPYERRLPPMSLMTLADLENGGLAVIDTSDGQLRERYEASAAKRAEAHQKLMKKIGAGYIAVGTDQSYVKALQKFFKLRAVKR